MTKVLFITDSVGLHCRVGCTVVTKRNLECHVKLKKVSEKLGECILSLMVKSYSKVQPCQESCLHVLTLCKISLTFLWNYRYLCDG